jgi:hypothetical protein
MEINLKLNIAQARQIYYALTYTADLAIIQSDEIKKMGNHFLDKQVMDMGLGFSDLAMKIEHDVIQQLPADEKFI